MSSSKNAKHILIGSVIISICSIEKTDVHMEKKGTGPLEAKLVAQMF